MNTVNCTVLFLVAVNKHKKKKEEKRFWIHLLISNRLITRHFYLKHPSLQEYFEKLINYYRMSRLFFEKVLVKIKKVAMRQIPI